MPFLRSSHPPHSADTRPARPQAKPTLNTHAPGFAPPDMHTRSHTTPLSRPSPARPPLAREAAVRPTARQSTAEAPQSRFTTQRPHTHFALAPRGAKANSPFRSACSGDDRDRTGDPLLAKQVLSQLSYAPMRKQDQHGSGADAAVPPGDQCLQGINASDRLRQSVLLRRTGSDGPGRTRTSDPTLIKRVL